VRLREPMKWLWTIVLLVGISAALPAHAKVSAKIAKRCHAMALKAHPSSLPDIKAVADLRRSYYRLCIARRGKMDQELRNRKYLSD
jgi:hypothetical protein